MKKTLIALAAVAVSSAAMAQVTISGAATVGWKSTSLAGVSNSGYGFNDAEVRFSFAEDLGGGLKASGSFTLDELTNDAASPTGDGAILTVSGGFGSVSISNVGASDFLPVDGLTAESDSMYATGDRLTYVSPTISGFKFTAIDIKGDVGEGLNVTNNGEDNSMILQADYSVGPLSVTALQQSFRNKTAAGEQSRTGIKATYNFGIAAVTYGSLSTDHGTADGIDETALSISAPLGPVTATYHMASSKTGSAAKLNGNAISLVYALSKRTNLSFYSESFDVSGAAATKEQSLYLNHSF